MSSHRRHSWVPTVRRIAITDQTTADKGTDIATLNQHRHRAAAQPRLEERRGLTDHVGPLWYDRIVAGQSVRRESLCKYRDRGLRVRRLPFLAVTKIRNHII